VARIVKRPRALDDLAEIWAYIAQDSTESADSFAALIDRNFQTLARHPAMGRSRPELAKTPAQLRNGPLRDFLRAAVKWY
jgi:plasmid stabilization system protein ParE